MPQLEKTLQGDLDTIEKKINMGMVTICALTGRRGRWETTVNGVRCVLLVYEKHDKKVYVKPDPPHEWQEDWDPDYKPTWFNIYARDDFQQAPHFSIAITLLDNGEEIKLCAITSGSGQDPYFIPDSGGEYDLFEALDITLNNLDRIYLQ